MCAPPLRADMRRPGLRVLMALVGLGLFAVYLLAAAGVVLVLQWVLSAGTGLGVTLVALVATGLLLGYLSYRVGTARLLAGIDAAPLARRRAPRVHRRLDALASRMGVARPALYVADVGAPNALTVGGGGATLVVDRRLLGLLTLDELEGILAHELAHVESSDSLIKTMTFSTVRSMVGLVYVLALPAILMLTGVARATAWVGGRPAAWDRTVAGLARRGIELLVLVLFSLLTLAFLAHSRRREFAADARAAAVTGRPLALARALRKIDRASRSPWGVRSPLYVQGEEEGPITELLSTHPPVDERIERLLAMGQLPRAVGA